MKTSIVQLEPHDDVLSIRDKISWSKTNRILLVWPVKGVTLQQFDLVMIYRACQKQGAQLALVTQEESVRVTASELGIPVFMSLQRAQTSFWRRQRTKRRKLDRLTHRSSLTKPEKPKPIAWIEQPPVRIGFFILGLLAVLILVGFFLPSARIRIFPSREIQSVVLDVRPNLKIAVPNISGGVPATLRTIVVEGQDSQAGSGTTIVPTKTAEGSVEFTNLTGESVKIPAGLIVLSVENPVVRFMVTQPIELPAGLNQKAQGRVRAVSPGSSGNVPAGVLRAVEGVLGTKVAVNNPAPTIGGQDQQASAPTQTDRAELRERVLSRLENTALEELRTTAGGDYVLEPTLRLKSILEEVFDPPDDRQSDFLRLSIRAEFEAWSIKASDLETLAYLSLDAGLPTYQRGVKGTLMIETPGKVVVNDDVTIWQVRVTRSVEDVAQKEQILAVVTGRTPLDAKNQLSTILSQRQEPEIDLWPSWWPGLPFLRFRIAVEVE